jgi:hypothetical protein
VGLTLDISIYLRKQLNLHSGLCLDKGITSLPYPHYVIAGVAAKKEVSVLFRLYFSDYI